jgi:hypothetical protein
LLANSSEVVSIPGFPAIDYVVDACVSEAGAGFLASKSRRKSKRSSQLVITAAVDADTPEKTLLCAGG